MSTRSVFRDYRRVEVIVQAGAENVLMDLGAVGRHQCRTCTDSPRDREGARRCAEVDIEILGLRRPVRPENAEEGERRLDAAADRPAAFGVRNISGDRAGAYI